jgi:hypothetical protein
MPLLRHMKINSLFIIQRRCPQNAILEQVILQKKEEFGISCNISVETVSSQIK